MKNILLASNIVLLILVGILFYLHFSSKKGVKVKEGNARVQPANSGTGSVVGYLDLDSLQNNYDYYKKIKTEFEKKQAASDNEITAMQKRYQNRATQLQQKGPTMNQQEQEAAMKEIGQMQQDLQAKKQTLDNNLFDYNTKMKEDILKRIQDFLKEYNRDGRFSYVFSYEPGLMFYKDSTLNITNAVINGLNDVYKKSSK